MSIAVDKKGDRLVSVRVGPEDELLRDLLHPMPLALALVHGPEGILLVYNRYRKEWELPGGMIDPGETPAECAMRECLEESGVALTSVRFSGLMEFRLQPDRFNPQERTEYGALYSADVEDPPPFEENQEMSDRKWIAPDAKPSPDDGLDLYLLSYYIP